MPKFPAIAERLEAELDATKKRLSKVRADQSISDYRLAGVQKELEATKSAVKSAARTAVNATTVVELEMQRFVARNIHPEAAKALREFAAEALRVKAQNEHVVRARTTPTSTNGPVSCLITDERVLENWPEGAEVNIPN